jgi:serine/threonine-protein kinase
MHEADKALAARLTEALGASYTLEGEIGRGGMGVVYGARDERLKRKVAIKVLPPELGFREEIRTRFLREAETSARLTHPHIVPIYSVGESADRLVYFIMAFIDGEPLSAKLKRRGRLPPEEARRILAETADALGAAHALGIIHRDVKPDNILLEGTRGRVVVTDFGIAKALSSTTGGATLTATGVAIGTPHFMSPEQAAGDREIDGRSDLYSLGVVGYQILAGELPFHAPTVPGILMKQITERPPLLTDKRPDCPEDLAAAVMRCLEKDPEERWPTADTLRRALESRSATLSRPHAAAAPSRVRPAPPAAVPLSRHDARLARRKERQALRRTARQVPATGEPGIVQEARASFVRWASLSGSLFVLDIVTGQHVPSWSLIVAGVTAAVSLVPKSVRLWQGGYSWRDVLDRPPAPDAVEARLRKETRLPLDLPAPTADEFGSQRTVVQQARSDRLAILKTVEKLPASERNLLPDIRATADALLKRTEELARMLHAMSGDIEEGAFEEIDAKIAAAEAAPPGPERDRQVGTFQRQRQALMTLRTQRLEVMGQLESCGLAMQNVRFDLLRLKAAGVAAVLGDLTQATQQARALAREVDHVIAAAGEIREALGDAPRA